MPIEKDWEHVTPCGRNLCMTGEGVVRNNFSAAFDRVSHSGFLYKLRDWELLMLFFR